MPFHMDLMQGQKLTLHGSGQPGRLEDGSLEPFRNCLQRWRRLVDRFFGAGFTDVHMVWHTRPYQC
jgi:hypothetical protein